MPSPTSIDLLHASTNGFLTSPRVARELIERADVLRRHPKLGRAIAGRDEYREMLLQVLGGAYALQYRYDRRSIPMLRVFDGREAR
jgi:hypothetical protein